MTDAPVPPREGLDDLASHAAWEYHLEQDDVREMDDAEALRIFRTTAFLHTSVKSK